MTTSRNPDQIVAAWLDEGPNQLPDETRRAIAVDIRTTNQRRRGVFAPWRVTNVNGMSRLVLATIAVVVALGGGLYLVGSRAPGPPAQVGAQPAPSSPTAPSPSASPTSPSIPEMTETFTSSTNGFSIAYPAGATVQAATEPGSPSSETREGQDFIRGTDPVGVFRASSTVAPEDVSIDEWIDEFITGAEAGTCNPPRATLPEITIDGQAGRIRDTCPEEVEATVVVGRRVYVFTLFHDGPEARAVFDAFAATIDLRPEDALEVASPSPS